MQQKTCTTFSCAHGTICLRRAFASSPRAKEKKGLKQCPGQRDTSTKLCQVMPSYAKLAMLSNNMDNDRTMNLVRSPVIEPRNGTLKDSFQEVSIKREAPHPLPPPSPPSPFFFTYLCKCSFIPLSSITMLRGRVLISARCARYMKVLLNAVARNVKRRVGAPTALVHVALLRRRG